MSGQTDILPHLQTFVQAAPSAWNVLTPVVRVNASSLARVHLKLQVLCEHPVHLWVEFILSCLCPSSFCAFWSSAGHSPWCRGAVCVTVWFHQRPEICLLPPPLPLGALPRVSWKSRVRRSFGWPCTCVNKGRGSGNPQRALTAGPCRAICVQEAVESRARLKTVGEVGFATECKRSGVELLMYKGVRVPGTHRKATGGHWSCPELPPTPAYLDPSAPGQAGWHTGDQGALWVSSLMWALGGVCG